MEMLISCHQRKVQSSRAMFKGDECNFLGLGGFIICD